MFKDYANKVYYENVLAFENGTYDYDTLEPISFESGYQVSFERKEHPLSDSEYNDIANRLAQTYGKAYIGIWDGIELSYHIDDLEDALRVGRMFSQIAIWDWKNSTEIYL